MRRAHSSVAPPTVPTNPSRYLACTDRYMQMGRPLCRPHSLCTATLIVPGTMRPPKRLTRVAESLSRPRTAPELGRQPGGRPGVLFRTERQIAYKTMQTGLRAAMGNGYQVARPQHYAKQRAKGWVAGACRALSWAMAISYRASCV